MDLEIGHRRPLYGHGRPFYGRDLHFSPMKEEIIGSDNSLNISKTDADVNFTDANVYFKINFGR